MIWGFRSGFSSSVLESTAHRMPNGVLSSKLSCGEALRYDKRNASAKIEEAIFEPTKVA